jgi:hypothetical protein
MSVSVAPINRTIMSSKYFFLKLNTLDMVKGNRLKII